MSTHHNIIILTSGLSGSSVVANLISRAGYWKGNETCKKADYNTHENSRLVELNTLLLKQVNYDQQYSKEACPEKSDEVKVLFKTIDLEPFKQFVNECELSGAWIWKDPRLWITLPFWMPLLEKEKLMVIFVDRLDSQRWISELLRRNIQTFDYCKKYNQQINHLIIHMIEQYNLPHCKILFDNLILKPEETLANLNKGLNSSLSLDDLKAVYNKPLYVKIRGIKSLFLACLIYLKNYYLRLK